MNGLVIIRGLIFLSKEVIVYSEMMSPWSAEEVEESDVEFDRRCMRWFDN